MADQGGATGSSRSGGSATRKLKWLGVFVLVLIAGYTALWFFLAGRLEAGVETAIARAQENGTSLVCEDREVRGYPFRLGVFCDGTVAETEAGTVRAGAFRSAAQIYRPGLVISEVDGPFAAEANGARIEGQWKTARASTRFGTSQLQLGIFELRDATLNLATPGATPVAATVGALTASTRPNGSNLDAALEVTGLDIEPIQGRDVPPMDVSLDATVSGAGTALAYDGEPVQSLRGRDVELRRLDLGILEGGHILTNGTVAVDDAGLATGEVQVSFSDLEATLGALAGIAPELAPQIEAIRPVLGQAGGGLLGNVLGDAAKDADAATAGTTQLTITLDQGRARVGFIPLGQVPPLP